MSARSIPDSSLSRSRMAGDGVTTATVAAARMPTAARHEPPTDSPPSEPGNTRVDEVSPVLQRQADLSHASGSAELVRDDARDAVRSQTAVAVAYWYQRHPDMHPADIAARIGRSERTVPAAPPTIRPADHERQRRSFNS